MKLQEIFDFHKRGGCCKALCVHCRSYHVCGQKQKVAIIDYSSGVDIGESFNAQNGKPMDLQQTLASVVGGAGYGPTTSKFDKIVDLYTLNMIKSDQ